MDIIKFAFLMTIALIDVCSSALPPQIKVCPKSSPDLTDCLKSSIEYLKPFLKTGEIASGFKIDGIDPLFIGNLSISRGFEVNQWDMRAYGVSDFKVDKIRLNLDNFKLEMILSMPKVATKAKYDLKWQLGSLNIEGGGNGYANLENAKIKLKLTGSQYSKRGTEYLNIDKVKLEVKPSNIRVRYEGLFNGQRELENIGNNYINQNIDTIAKDIMPIIEQAMEERILQTANQVFEKAPFNEFFP